MREIHIRHSDIPIQVPDILKPYTPYIRETRLGKHIAFASGQFAEPIDNKQLMEMYAHYNPNADEQAIKAARKVIEHTGIQVRYMSPPLSPERTPETVFDEAATVGALLTRRAMEVQGMKRIDFLKVSSATLPDNMVLRILTKMGIDPESVDTFETRTACAGGVINFIDAITNPKHAHQQGVIVALERLGYLLQPHHFREQLAVSSIFGDDNIAVAFNTDDFRAKSWKIRVIPDGGVIQLNTSYQFTDQGSQPVPDHLHIEFAPGGTAMTRATDKEFFLNIINPGMGITALMNNEATAKHFIEYTPDVLLDVYEEFIREYADPSVTVESAAVHDPSAFVSTLIARTTRMKAKLREMGEAGLTRFPKLEFLLDKMRASNSSSATTLRKLQYLAEHNLVLPRGYSLLAAPGIGSAIGAIIFEFKPKE